MDRHTHTTKRDLSSSKPNLSAISTKLSSNTSNLTVKLQHLSAYRRFFELDDQPSNGLPLAYAYMIAAPCLLTLLSRRDFPERRSNLMLERFQVKRLHNLPIDGAYNAIALVDHFPISEHQSSARVRARVYLKHDDKVVWAAQSNYRIINEQGPSLDERVRDTVDAPEDLTEWNFNVASAWRYAQLSRDYNPIHTLGSAARWHGFKKPLANPMWLLGHCIARLENFGIPPNCTIDVRMKNPVLLPNDVVFESTKVDQGLQFYLDNADTGHGHLFGQLTTTSSADPVLDTGTYRALKDEI